MRGFFRRQASMRAAHSNPLPNRAGQPQTAPRATTLDVTARTRHAASELAKVQRPRRIRGDNG
jgi:hypothetical protein